MHDRPQPTNRTLSMLLAFALVALALILVTVGMFGVALFIAGWGLGWLTAS